MVERDAELAFGGISVNPEQKLGSDNTRKRVDFKLFIAQMVRE